MTQIVNEETVHYLPKDCSGGTFQYLVTNKILNVDYQLTGKVDDNVRDECKSLKLDAKRHGTALIVNGYVELEEGGPVVGAVLVVESEIVDSITRLWNAFEDEAQTRYGSGPLRNRQRGLVTRTYETYTFHKKKWHERKGVFPYLKHGDIYMVQYYITGTVVEPEEDALVWFNRYRYGRFTEITGEFIACTEEDNTRHYLLVLVPDLCSATTRDVWNKVVEVATEELAVIYDCE